MDMKRLLIALAVCALPAAALAQSLTATNYSVDEPMPRPADAKLVWSDEFDGNALDTTKWRYDGSRNKAGWYNGEQQYYGARAENVRVGNGQLVIEARHEKLPARDYPDYGGQAITRSARNCPARAAPGPPSG
jgi:beta-glucanase (GH16 family)